MLAEINLRLGRWARVSSFCRILAFKAAILKLLASSAVADGVFSGISSAGLSAVSTGAAGPLSSRIAISSVLSLPGGVVSAGAAWAGAGAGGAGAGLAGGGELGCTGSASSPPPARLAWASASASSGGGLFCGASTISIVS